MPISYNPSVQYRGDQYLYQGISDAGDTIGDTIKSVIQKGKELKATRQMAVDGLGMDADEVDQMSLPQLKGKLAGEALKQSRTGQQLLQQNQQLQNENLKFRQMVDQANRTAVGNFYDNLPGGQTSGQPGSDPNSGDPSDASAFDPAVIMDAARKAKLPPEMLMQIMHGSYFGARGAAELQQDNAATGAGGDDIVAKELPGGYMGFRMPGSRQMDIRPNMNNVGQASSVTDDEGNPVGQVVNVGGKAIFKPSKPAASGALMPVLDPASQKPIPGFGMDATGKVHDFRDTMQKNFGSTTGAPTAALPLPKTKDQLQSGALYDTPRGTAKWDGSKFVPQ